MYSARFTAVFATLVKLALAAPAAAEMTISAGSVAEATFGETAPTEPRKTEPEKEWQLTPRLRLQYDVAALDGPNGLIGNGNFADIRRARVGVDLKNAPWFCCSARHRAFDGPNHVGGCLCPME